MSKWIWLFVLLFLIVFTGSHVYAAGKDKNDSGTRDDSEEETRLEIKAKSYTKALEELFEGDLKAELSEEERSTVRKTYLKLYKHSFDGFFLNIKERFSFVFSEFERETKGCGLILAILFLVVSFIQGANNKIVIGRYLHLHEGKVMERYRIKDEHLGDSQLVGKIVRFAMVLGGLMLVAIVFRSDGILFKNLFLLEFRETMWRVIAYGCIRMLISFLAMFIPFIIAYLIALPVAVIKDAISERTYERGPTFHAQALDLLDNRIILGVLGVLSGIVFLYVNYVSWFIYLEAAGMFQ